MIAINRNTVVLVAIVYVVMTFTGCQKEKQDSMNQNIVSSEESSDFTTLAPETNSELLSEEQEVDSEVSETENQEEIEETTKSEQNETTKAEQETTDILEEAVRQLEELDALLSE